MGNRKSIRLAGRDYSAPGSYFVTMCTLNRHAALGTMAAERVVLSRSGQIVAETWRWLARQYSYVSLDEWCIMPDHFHGILSLHDERGAAVRKTIGGLIGAFKTRSTSEINRLRNAPGEPFWQRDFWDRVIRDHVDLERVRLYVRQNISDGAWHSGRREADNGGSSGQ